MDGWIDGSVSSIFDEIINNAFFLFSTLDFDDKAIGEAAKRVIVCGFKMCNNFFAAIKVSVRNCFVASILSLV